MEECTLCDTSWGHSEMGSSPRESYLVLEMVYTLIWVLEIHICTHICKIIDFT